MSEKNFRFFQDPGDGTTLRAGGAPAMFAFNASPADGVRHRLFFAAKISHPPQLLSPRSGSRLLLLAAEHTARCAGQAVIGTAVA